MAKAAAPTHQSIKVKTEVYEHARALVEELAQRGWDAVGVTRSESPTMSSVIEEALIMMSKRARGSR